MLRKYYLKKENNYKTTITGVKWKAQFAVCFDVVFIVTRKQFCASAI